MRCRCIPIRFFSLQAWAVTFLFFCLDVWFWDAPSRLYDNRKNEEYRFKSFRHSLLVVLLSIAAMVAGVMLLGRMLQTQTNEAFLYLGGPACSFWWVFTSRIARFRFCCTDLQNKICAISTKKKICSSWGRLGGASILLAGQWLWWRFF